MPPMPADALARNLAAKNTSGISVIRDPTVDRGMKRLARGKLLRAGLTLYN